MIWYETAETVRAFTAGRGDALPCAVAQARQVHGTGIATVDRPGLGREDLDGYDALVTDIPGIAIGVRTADCIPLLMYDGRAGAIAAVHSGWRGTVGRISQEVIRRMRRDYSTEPSGLKVIIGPGICGGCFQVGEEVVDMFRMEGFPMDGIHSWCSPKKEGDIRTGHHLDLIAANKYLLLQEGILEENIRISGICTFEDRSLYSARREGASCGRNINAIMLL